MTSTDAPCFSLLPRRNSVSLLLLLWAMQDPRALLGRTPSPRNMSEVGFPKRPGARSLRLELGTGKTPNIYLHIVPMFHSTMTGLLTQLGCETSLPSCFPLMWRGSISGLCGLSPGVSPPTQNLHNSNCAHIQPGDTFPRNSCLSRDLLVHVPQHAVLLSACRGMALFSITSITIIHHFG